MITHCKLKVFFHIYFATKKIPSAKKFFSKNVSTRKEIARCINIQNHKLQSMSQKYASYLENVYDAFPALKEVQKTDSNLFLKMELHELMKKGYMNFVASRKELYRLSVLIEKYAVGNKVPLIASFEEEGKFKYAEKRYLKIMRQLPYTWVIGNFQESIFGTTISRQCKNH